MRTLILKFGAIGDVIMAIPAAYELHRQGHAIDWVVGHAALPVLKLYPWINAMPIDEKALLTGSSAAKMKVVVKLWRELAGRQYTQSAILYYDRRYRLLTLPIRGGRKILLSHSDRSFRLLPGRHHTDEFARILLGWPDERRPQQLAPVQVAPEFLPSTPLALSAKPRVVLAPAGAKNLLADDLPRRWHPENYVGLAQLLVENGMEVVLIGGPGDGWIQPLFSGLPLTDLIGRCSLPQTLALLDEAAVLVTHDTGPLHLAGITRCSIVAIFGPTDPRGRLPQRSGTVALWGGEGFACRPCYDGHSFAPCPANDCMATVMPAMVLAEVITLVQARSAGTLAPPRVATSPRPAIQLTH